MIKYINLIEIDYFLTYKIKFFQNIFNIKFKFYYYFIIIKEL